MRHCGEVRSVFQSTLPRRERHAIYAQPFSTSIISIHAPAKGATVVPFILYYGQPPISIHAPAKGATMTVFWLRLQWTEFQSTLPRRERLPRSPSPSRMGDNFNPRSREGSDLPLFVSIAVLREFQSTLPRRERQIIFSIIIIISIFQSTLPRRERLYLFTAP